MESCKKCINYSTAYDNFRQQYNDVQDENTRYCINHTNGIPKKIVNDKTKCPYFTEKIITVETSGS